MIPMKQPFDKLISHKDLTSEEMIEIMTAMMTGKLEDAQIAAFLALLRSKGHALGELKAAADIMRQYGITINLDQPGVDIVGTGGDGLNTFNISTVSSFVVAAAGVPVAKHGNISVSSNSGSANFLNDIGINLHADHALLKSMYQQANICFLFAPNFHPALKYAAPARKALGIRTLFNLLGPLLNPAQVTKQVVGVFEQKWQPLLSDVLVHLGSQRHCVLTAEDGMDEVSLTSPTYITEYASNQQTKWILNPKEYGFNHASLDAIIIKSVDDSIRIGKSVLNNDPGPAKDIVVLNAALAIYVARDDCAYGQALTLAEQAISSGKAKACFDKLVQLSRPQEIS